MSVTERPIYKQVARATGDDTVEVAAKSDGAALRTLTDAEVDDSPLQKVLDSDAIESDELVAATRKYGKLDGDKRSQFRELLADDDLRDSWVRAAGDADVSKEAVETALRQVDSVRYGIQFPL
jgi:hypothetical protein